MGDVFSLEKRSEIMSRVKGWGNLATEERLVKILRQNGLTGWRRKSETLGKPDFVFPAARLAIFVDGCFWHSCPKHGSIPASNRIFWLRKLNRNVKRDKFVTKELRALGWSVVRIWQHELRKPSKVVQRINRSLTQKQTVRGAVHGKRKKSRSN